MKIITGGFLLLILFCFCTTSKHVGHSFEKLNSYSIKAIDSINNWYIIYAIKQDSTYKIVVKKENGQWVNCNTPVKVGNSYNLELHSRKNEVPTINGIKIQPVNPNTVQCYAYDETTNICIEPTKGIYDLYHSPNFKGLCYNQKQ